MLKKFWRWLFPQWRDATEDDVGKPCRMKRFSYCNWEYGTVRSVNTEDIRFYRCKPDNDIKPSEIYRAFANLYLYCQVKE